MQKSATKPEVIPYVHKVTQKVKKAVTRPNAPVVPPAPRRLSLCARTPGGDKKKAACGKKHTRRHVDRAVAVVHEPPLSRGKFHTGQTGRCVKDRAREHELTLTNDRRAHPPAH